MLSDRTPVAIVDFFSTGFRGIWTSLPLSHPIIFGPWSLTSLDVVILSTFRTLVQTSYRALRVLPQCLKLPGTPGAPQYLKLPGIPSAPQPLLGHPGFYEKNKAGGKTRGARRHAAIRVGGLTSCDEPQLPLIQPDSPIRLCIFSKDSMVRLSI